MSSNIYPGVKQSLNQPLLKPLNLSRVKQLHLTLRNLSKGKGSEKENEKK